MRGCIYFGSAVRYSNRYWNANVMQELSVDFELVAPCKVQAVNDADKVFILEKIDESKLEAVVDEVNLIKTFSQNLLGDLRLTFILAW